MKTFKVVIDEVHTIVINVPEKINNPAAMLNGSDTADAETTKISNNNNLANLGSAT